MLVEEELTVPPERDRLEDLMDSAFIGSTAASRSDDPDLPPGLLHLHVPQASQTSSTSAVVRGTWASARLGDEIYGYAWMDNGPTYFLSTFHKAADATQVQRRVKRQGVVTFDAPLVASDYNENMGGVDLSDQKRAAYTCTRRYATRSRCAARHLLSHCERHLFLGAFSHALLTPIATSSGGMVL